MIADTGGVDRLPSFITGPQPQVNGAPGGYEGGGGGERFPRRRRRPHGPRPDRHGRAGRARAKISIRGMSR